MKIRLLSIIMVISLICSGLCFTSCGTEKNFPVKINGVVIDREPENVIVLDKNLADIISCIGYDIKLVGRSEEVNQEDFDIVPVIGSNKELNIEEIKKLNVDLVIGNMTLDSGVKKQLEKEKIPVLKIECCQTKKQLSNMYQLIGEALGGKIEGIEKAKKAYKSFSDTLENIKHAAKADTIVKTVCYLYVSDGVLKTMNKDTWGNIILEDTGAINVFGNENTNVVDKEKLLLSNPDYIFCDNQTTVDYLNESSLYSLDALENDTYIVPYDEITMQGYTALNTLESMLKNMYPDEFR